MALGPQAAPPSQAQEEPVVPVSRPLPVALVQAPPARPRRRCPVSPRRSRTWSQGPRRPAWWSIPSCICAGSTGPTARRRSNCRTRPNRWTGAGSSSSASSPATWAIWLAPGSVCERGQGGELFNTALAFSPEGRLAASSRKVFPWRPTRPTSPGTVRRPRPARDRPGRLRDLLRRLVPGGRPPPGLDGRRSDLQPGHDHHRRPRPRNWSSPAPTPSSTRSSWSA